VAEEEEEETIEIILPDDLPTVTTTIIIATTTGAVVVAAAAEDRIRMGIVVGLVLGIGMILEDHPTIDVACTPPIATDWVICETLVIASPKAFLLHRHQKKRAKKPNIWLC
jgi:hypothetical protein